MPEAARCGRRSDSARPEVVVHLAAEIASQRSRERIEEVNVEGTRRLLEAAEAAGARRVVFASTVVTGDAHGALLEESSPLPVETAYGRSKQEGERLLSESPLEGVVLRPRTYTAPADGSRASSSPACGRRGASR